MIEKKSRKLTHTKYGKCGFNDRGAAIEFRHINLEKFNKACDAASKRLDPHEFSKRKAYWGKAKPKQ